MKLMEDKIDKKKCRKIIIHCILILGALLLMFFFAQKRVFDEVAKTFVVEDISVNMDDNEKYVFNEETVSLVQEFEVTTDILWGIELQFARNQKRPQGDITITVADANGLEVFSGEMPISSLDNDERTRLVFQQIVPATKGERFAVTLQVKDIAKGDRLAILTDRDDEVNGVLSDATGELSGNIQLGQIYGQRSYMTKIFYGLFLASALLTYGLYFALFIRKAKIEMVFLVVMIFIGLVYAMVMPPGNIPDEAYHHRTSYAYSNILLGRGGDFNKRVKMDETDYEFYQVVFDGEVMVASPDTYRVLLRDFLKSDDHREMMTIKDSPGAAAAYLFSGQTLGITIGRLAGFNGLTNFYLGRIFNALAFALMTFLAMRLLPFNKMTMFALCLFPMTAQLVGSLSYDSVILGIALVLFAQLAALIFGDKKVATKKDFIILAVSGILLGGCKGGAYVPLLLISFLIPIKHFKKPRNKLLLVGGIIVGAILMFSLAAIHTVSSSVGDIIVPWANEPPYTMAWIFANPLDFLQLLLNTLFESGPDIIESIFGRVLGWFNIPLRWTIVWGFMGVFLLSCVRVVSEPRVVVLTKKQKNVMGVSILISVAIIAAAMMFSWTPESSKTIEGIQGRYFLPLLLPLVFCLKTKNLTLQKSLDNKLIFALGWIQILAIINILDSVVSSGLK